MPSQFGWTTQKGAGAFDETFRVTVSFSEFEDFG
jgi:hypothetical protein